jgi:hypothetical protein
VQRFLSLLQQIPSKLKEAVETGIEFNATMENARSGIAGLLLQFQPGRFHDFEQALKGADDVIGAIRDKAKGQPLQPLIEAFQTATGVATDAGISLDKQVSLIVDIGRATRAISLPQQQIVQETRALFNGEINRNAQLSIALGITNEMVENAKQEGRLYELIESKLSGINTASGEALKNYSQLLEAVKFTVQESLGELTQPIFQTLKNGLTDLKATIGGNREQLQDFFRMIDTGVKIAVDVLNFAITRAGAFADLFVGNWGQAIFKFIGQFEVFGLKIGAWVDEARLEIFGGWEKIKIYFAGTFTWIEDSMAIMWQRVLLMTQKSALDIANTWNKVSPFKIDTAGMAVGIVTSELMLEQMIKGRDKRVEDARREASGQAGAGAGAAAFEASAGGRKRGSLGGGGPVLGKNTQEGEALVDEIRRAYEEATMGKEGLQQAKYEETLARLKDEVKENEKFQYAKYMLDYVYGRKRSDLENDREQKAYEDYLDRLDKEKQAHAQSLRTEMQQDADALRLKRDEVALDEAKLEADFTKTEVQKKGERIRLLNVEIGAVQELIDKFTKLRDLQTDDAAKQALDQQITGLSGEKRQLEVRMVGLTNAPDPMSFGQQFQAKFVEIMNQMGTLAERSARAFCKRVEWGDR